jgi:putative nucleotidyltransferase with HDIG domain
LSPLRPTEEQIRQLVDKIENVPTLPIVVSKILAATQDPRTSAEDVNKIILTDQALTAKILKLVNSAFFGFPRRIGTVTEAVVILGFGTIRNLAITASVFHSFGTTGGGKFDRSAFWRHCVGVGVASRRIARMLNMPTHEDVFIAGLLHDLGKVVLDQYFRDDFREALALAKEKEQSLYVSEKEVFGLSHAEIGMWLAEHWNMPLFLCQTIGYHHEPSKATEDVPVVSMVHIANSVVRYKGIGNGGDEYKPPIQREALERVNFTKKHLDEILENIEKDFAQAEDFAAIF